jgi:AraC-like DNA-binding protein
MNSLTIDFRRFDDSCRGVVSRIELFLRPVKTTILPDTMQFPAVAERLAGSGQLSKCHSFALSAWLRVDVFEVVAAEPAEETGRLVCLPFSEDAFGLQLAFLMSQEEQESDLLILFHIHPEFLAQWPSDFLHHEQAFRFDHAAEHELRTDSGIRNILVQFQQRKEVSNFGAAMHYMEQAIQLLRRSVEQLNVHFAPCIVPACRFLAFDSEREKIHKAREILDAHFDERMTIKELSRKVAMNECYLKKGFKTLTGSTIHEYIAARRIESARRMLQVEGKPVTEVAASLGYSSISHFSTAFKKATGLKPCELLQ